MPRDPTVMNIKEYNREVIMSSVKETQTCYNA